MANVCKTCGGTVVREGNFYVCEFCRNKWEIDSANDVHAVDRANAWAALRDGDFEKSAELFEEIIVKESKNHEAYWGRALALAGIVYVTDMNESKKVPTCNNITEDSFINDKDVQKAISLAPGEISAEYKKQAEYIEKVRVEWLEKASKEPAYDVFISFKDSDRENGIERTQDSVDAQDLYNALVAEGYKVFFSRISLRDKIAEQYEPYIYNAIKTAKVMIVFGEKAEYFSSVWIKNEWSRFKTRIEKGEKHKNSLVVVYKNMNPGDLPAVLKSRQCLNASDMTFLSDLTRHIRRVVDESKRNVHLEKIEIAGGQMSKKATSLSTNAVQKREIGAGAIAETSISEKQSLELINTYINMKQWPEASNLTEDILFNNPTCAPAIISRLLIKYQVPDVKKLVDFMSSFTEEDFGVIEKYLSCASKTDAKNLLSLIYSADGVLYPPAYYKALEVILPFDFDERDRWIDYAFRSSIKRAEFPLFCLMLNTLDPSEVDEYIAYNLDYASRAKNINERLQCVKNVLSVDEGNEKALKLIVATNLETKASNEEVIKSFETLLKYCKAPNSVVREYLSKLAQNISRKEDCELAKQLIRYYTKEISALKDILVAISTRIISVGLFAEAEYFLNLVLSFDANNPDVYWLICLMRIEATSEETISNSTKMLRDVPEFNRYLTLVNKDRQTHCITLSKAQADAAGKRFTKLNKTNKLESVSFKMFLVFAIIGLIAVVVGILNANGGTAFLGVLYTAGMIAMMIYVKKGAKETKNKIKDIDENLNARK